MESYNIFTLPNGLRVVHVPSESPVGYCGVVVGAGSRNDGEALGLAHFVEHTLFKGTAKHRASYINNRMEQLGGYLDAYTTKERTVVYSGFPKEYLRRAMSLIADMTQNSVFPNRELELEREVVMEEAAGYRDTPSEAIFDDFSDLLWKGSDLGHNILGTADSVAAIESSHCRQFLEPYYTPSNMVLFVQGQYTEPEVQKLAAACFTSPATATAIQRPEVTAHRFEEEMNFGLHQCHVVLGAPVFSRHDDRIYALSLLNNILGGPCNSLLNIALRERRGWVYTVESGCSHYCDCGLFYVYFGCDHNKAHKSLKLVRQIIGDLAQTRISEAKLEAAKRRKCGTALFEGENPESYAISSGAMLLNYGSMRYQKEEIERIKAITADDIRACAELLLPSSTLIFR